MSTLAYATLSTRRNEETEQGISKFIDMVAALVPAEVLAIHAIMLSLTTKTTQDAAGKSITEITDPATLKWVFIGGLVLSAGFYVLPHLSKWAKKDFWRSAIPPCAFIAWTMLQKATAFDAIWPKLAVAPRTGIALFLAVALGLLSIVLTKKTDQEDPPHAEEELA